MDKIKNLFCLAVLGLAIYSGYVYATPYFRFYSFKSEVEGMMRFDVKPHEDYRKKIGGLIYKAAQEKGVPITEDDIVFEGAKWVDATVEIIYEDEINIFNQYKKNPQFIIKFESSETN